MKQYFLASALLISPLHYCHTAEETTKQQIIQDLFNADAQRNTEKIIEIVETVLSLALKTNRDSPTIISTLLALGANPNLPNKHGQTPLHVCALYSGRDHTFEDISLLLRHGANPLAKNNQGETPRETISSYNWTLSPEISQEISQLLQEAETKIIQKKIKKIREQGIPQRNFKMRGKKIPAHLLAVASSSSESHSILFSKPWPEKNVPQ